MCAPTVLRIAAHRTSMSEGSYDRQWMDRDEYRTWSKGKGKGKNKGGWASYGGGSWERPPSTRSRVGAAINVIREAWEESLAVCSIAGAGLLPPVSLPLGQPLIPAPSMPTLPSFGAQIGQVPQWQSVVASTQPTAPPPPVHQPVSVNEPPAWALPLLQTAENKDTTLKELLTAVQELKQRPSTTSTGTAQVPVLPANDLEVKIEQLLQRLQASATAGSATVAPAESGTSTKERWSRERARLEALLAQAQAEKPQQQKKAAKRPPPAPTADETTTSDDEDEDTVTPPPPAIKAAKPKCAPKKGKPPALPLKPDVVQVPAVDGKAARRKFIADSGIAVGVWCRYTGSQEAWTQRIVTHTTKADVKHLVSLGGRVWKKNQDASVQLLAAYRDWLQKGC